MSGEKCASVRAVPRQDIIRTRRRQIDEAFAAAQRYLSHPVVAQCATEREAQNLRGILEAIAARRGAYSQQADADRAQAASASDVQRAGEILGRIELRAQMIDVIAQLRPRVSRLTGHAALGERARFLAERLDDVELRARSGEETEAAIADMGAESTRLIVAAQVIDKNEAELERRAHARFMTAEDAAAERDELSRAVAAAPERAAEIETALLQRLREGSAAAFEEVASQDEDERQRRVARLYTRVGDTFRELQTSLTGARRSSVDVLLRRTLEEIRADALDDAEASCQRAEDRLAAARSEPDEPVVAIEAWTADADDLMVRAVAMAESDDIRAAQLGAELEGRIRAASELGEARWRSQEGLIRRDLETCEAMGDAHTNRELAARAMAGSIRGAAAEVGFVLPTDFEERLDRVEDLYILALRTSGGEAFSWQIEWLSDVQTYRLVQDAAQPEAACEAFHAVTDIMESNGDPALRIDLSESARRPLQPVVVHKSTDDVSVRGRSKEKEKPLPK